MSHNPADRVQDLQRGIKQAEAESGRLKESLSLCKEDDQLFSLVRHKVMWAIVDKPPLVQMAKWLEETAKQLNLTSSETSAVDQEDILD